MTAGDYSPPGAGGGLRRVNRHTPSSHTSSQNTDSVIVHQSGGPHDPCVHWLMTLKEDIGALIPRALHIA